MTATLQSCYERFATMYANSRPTRTASELDAAIHAAGLGYADVGEDWLRQLSHGWVYFDREEPFADEKSNREYRRLVAV